MKIVIDCDIPYINGVFEPFAEVMYMKGSQITPEDVRDADAMIVRTRTKCNRNLLAGSNVKTIASATIGYDHIDVEYCAEAGIDVFTAAGSNSRGVLQWIGAALVHAARRQGWKPENKTIGIVGVGHVGSLVARYASEWGFGVLCCDPPRKRSENLIRFVPLDEIVAKCDIITFHTPLTYCGQDATFHMANSGFFSNLKPGTLIINSSRGEVVDTAALWQAVECGMCECAIDTWENEPDIDRRLLSLSMLATPHIAGYSAQGKANASAMSVRAIARKYGLPLTDWYPSGSVSPVTPRPISWDELYCTISAYFDIAAQSAVFKKSPECFETIRDSYTYRTEYF